MLPEFTQDVEAALQALRNGQIILYPTSTIWAIGCDATNEKAVEKVLQQQQDSQNLAVLLADERDVLHYVSAPDLEVFDFLEQQERPTTVLFDGAVNLPDALLAGDGSIAIRLEQEVFCRHLIRRLRKPLLFTSANGSGHPEPRFFGEVREEKKAAVDYVTCWRQQDKTPAPHGQVVRWKGEGEVEYIRQ